MTNNTEICYARTFSASSPYKNHFFNILFLNICSLRKRLNDLTSYVHTNPRKIHVIILNETRLKSNDFHLFNIPGYTSHHSVREKNGGGVAIYVLKEFSKTNTLENYEFENCNFLTVDLISHNIKILGFYKPPDSNPISFTNRLNLILDKYSDLIACGDANLNLFSSDSNSNLRNYIDCIQLNGYKILNSLDYNMYTRLNTITGTCTCIDHCISDTTSKYDFCIALDDILDVDHKALLVSIHHPHPVKSENSFGKCLTFRKPNQIQISEALAAVDAQTFTELITNVTNIIDANTKTIKVREKFHKKFMNTDIYNYMIIRRNFLNLSRKYPSSPYARQQYLLYRNLVVSKIRIAKRERNDTIFHKTADNPRKTWYHINNLLHNRDAKNKDSCERLLVNGVVKTNKHHIADHFNLFFTSVAEAIKNNLSACAQAGSHHGTDNYQVNTPLNFAPCTVREVSDILRNLKSSDANDLYGISNNFLKLHNGSLAEPLTRVINTCIEDGFFPNELKKAVVKPIFKGGDKESASNYRPIAILPIFSKVFESVILSRFVDHLTENKILNDYQFGFVSKSNTEVAVLHLLSSIYKNLEDKKLTAAVFIDMKKAFDCVDHKILLDKLKLLKLPRNIEKLFLSYFENRYQCVDVDGARSGFLQVKAGIFQGSILGPTLFIFYVNEVFKLNLKGSIQLYADDIALVYGEKDNNSLKQSIESDLQKINVFFNSLCLEINSSKTKYIQFKGRTGLVLFNERSLNIVLGNETLERVKVYKYLGLYIDELLSFSEHVSHIRKKITPMIFAIRRIRHSISEKTAYQLYFAHIHSHLIFMNPLWSIASQDTLSQLFVLQKKVLRFIQYKDRLSPSAELFSEKILPLPVMNDYNLLILAFKIKNNLIRNNVTTRYVNEIHSYGTRQVGNFHVIKFDTKYGYADFYRRGLMKFNELHQDIKRFHSLKLFKTRLREYLYEKYEAENLV